MSSCYSSKQEERQKRKPGLETSPGTLNPGARAKVTGRTPDKGKKVKTNKKKKPFE